MHLTELGHRQCWNVSSTFSLTSLPRLVFLSTERMLDSSSFLVILPITELMFKFVESAPQLKIGVTLLLAFDFALDSWFDQRTAHLLMKV